MDRAIDIGWTTRTTAWRRAAATLAALSVAAAPARALTLEEAFSEAVRTNPAVRAAREAARARHENVPIARAAWMPTVQAEAHANRTRFGSVFNFSSFFAGGDAETSAEVSGQRIMTLTATQNLYHSGRNGALLRRADQEVLRAHAAVEDTEQAVLLRVATAYLDVLRAERTVDLRRASLAAFEARARETEAQFQVGDRTGADVAQAQAEREVAAAEVASARAELEIQRSLFEMLVGKSPRGLEAPGEPAGLPATLDDAVRAARDARPAVRAAEHGMEAARHAVRAASGLLGPRVDLRGAVTKVVGQGRLSFLPDSTDMSITVSVTMPIYQAGAAGARLRQAQRLHEQFRHERHAAAREAEQRVTSAWRMLQAARQRLAALETAVEASRAALAGIQREAGLGERTTREVLDAERNLVSRRVHALAAERDAIVGAYRLLEAIGALTARALGIDGAPDLGREAGDARWSLAPGLMSIGGR